MPLTRIRLAAAALAVARVLFFLYSRVSWRGRERGGNSAYSEPEEGLKLSMLKLFLRADHKGPVRGSTCHALASAGRTV
jgi:hypothetical protein